MANETNFVRGIDSKMEDRGLNGRKNMFKPSAPAGFVRPKPVPVPQKSK
jgi:hypothetical protein